MTFLWLMLILVSCVETTYVFVVDLVTPTPVYPITSTPELYITTSTTAPTYPTLRIASWKITDTHCKNGNVDKVKIQLVLEGGLLPYNYIKDIAIDEHGVANITVTSADGQSSSLC